MNIKAILDNTPVGKFKMPFVINENADLEDAYGDANMFVLDLQQAYKESGKVLHEYNIDFIPSNAYSHVVVSITTFNSEQEIVDEFFKEMDREQQARELMQKKYAPTNSGLAVPRGNVVS